MLYRTAHITSSQHDCFFFFLFFSHVVGAPLILRAFVTSIFFFFRRNKIALGTFLVEVIRLDQRNVYCARARVGQLSSLFFWCSHVLFFRWTLSPCYPYPLIFLKEEMKKKGMSPEQKHLKNKTRQHLLNKFILCWLIMAFSFIFPLHLKTELACPFELQVLVRREPCTLKPCYDKVVS